jgi:type I restriction enzyme S subunit
MKEANFKETEIGKIPVDWEVEYLGENLAENPKYGINAASVPFNSNLPTYLRITDISDDGRYLNNSPVSVNNSESSKYFLEEGDLVFARTGASVGKTYLYNLNDGRLVYAGFLIKLKPDNQTLNSVFLKYLTQNKFYKDWIIQNSMRTGQPGINGIQIKSFQIPLPPLSEQEKIAEVLSDTDLWIESTEALLAKKRQIKKGAMQKLLSPKEDWEVRKLGEVAEYRRGSFPQPYGLEKWYDEHNGMPFVQVFDVAKNMKLKSTTKQRISDLAKNYSVFVAKGNLVLTIQGSIGRIALTQYDSYVDRTLLIFTNFKIPMDKVFFMYKVYELFQIEKIKAPGGTIKTITKEELSAFIFHFPKSLKTQQEIAEILSSMDLEIESLENRLQKARQLKQGMMQDLLTGKVRLV